MEKRGSQMTTTGGIHGFDTEFQFPSLAHFCLPSEHKKKLEGTSRKKIRRGIHHDSRVNIVSGQSQKKKKILKIT